jgi:hypothetical protein
MKTAELHRASGLYNHMEATERTLERLKAIPAPQGGRVVFDLPDGSSVALEMGSEDVGMDAAKLLAWLRHINDENRLALKASLRELGIEI